MIARVRWRDAYSDDDLPPDGKAREDYLVETVGFVLAEGPVFLSLAAEVLPEDDGYRHITHIPLSVVEDRVDL